MADIARGLVAGLLLAAGLGAAPTTAAPGDRDSAATQVPVAKGRLYAVALGAGAAWKKGQPFKGPGLEQHRAYWRALHKDGRVAAAGPLGDGSGLALIRARSQKEADALIAADPAVKARILAAVARPYAADLMSVPVLVGR